MFRGTAGVDYPNFKTIPTTHFRCDDKIYEGGLYADVEAQCQVYHICHEGRKDSFLCGQGTIFNQEILACDYWYSTECEKAPSFYHVNSQIGKSGSSWLPPAGAHQHETPSNEQAVNYRPSNPNTLGGNDNSNFPQRDNGNSRTSSQQAGVNADNSQNNNQPDCCCQKYSYKTPWAFPSN